jgi:hypothetical protein
MQGNDRFDPKLRTYLDAFEASLDYCKPYWEQYARLIQFFKFKSFDALEGTYSKINLALGHSMVQDRIPKIHSNVFGQKRLVSVEADSPTAEITAPKAQAWLREILTDKVKIQSSIWPTLQGVLAGGTAYRMPYATYTKAGDGWKMSIGSRDIEYFHVLPAPGGGNVNPQDNEQTDAVPWVMVVDWWSESKIKYHAERGKLNKEAARRMLSPDGAKGQETFLEDSYRNKFRTVDNLEYSGQDAWRSRFYSIDDQSRRRRVVHWFRRDKHIIVGEDAYYLYEGPPVLPGGKIPLAKYITCPDLSGWFGIPFLATMEDVLKAVIMNVNYRFDHLIRTMFPTTWVRQDILQHKGYTQNDFVPRPYDMKEYPASIRDQNIRDLIWVDRGESVDPQTFLDEDRMKAFLQQLAGAMEKSSSLKDVVGNRTATGVTSILSELAGRPNMESIILENSGFREECTLLLDLAREHVNEPIRVKDPAAEDGFPWIDIEPDDLTDSYTVVPHGAQYLTDKNLSFQKMLAMYPFWNQNPALDQYELTSQSLEVADALPMPDKVMAPPMPAMPSDMGAAPGGMPGGAASPMDITQRMRGTRDRNTVEPRTGRAVPATTRV